MITFDDYKLWSFLTTDKISEFGNWTSYRLRYGYQQTDTLFVQHTLNHKKKAFPLGREGSFNGELDFACISKDTLRLMDLKTQKILKRDMAVSFKFSKNQKFVAIIFKSSDQKFSLEVLDRTGKSLFTGSQITSYVFDPSLNGVFYATEDNNKYGISMLLFKESVVCKQITKNHSNSFQNLIWKEESVAFIENKPENPLLYNFEIKKDRLSRLDPDSTQGFPAGMKISSEIYRNPIPSLDGSKVFFWLKEPLAESQENNSNGVQIWNAKDKLLTDFKKYMPFPKWVDKMAVWDVKNSSVRQITTQELSGGFLSADYKNVFIYDPFAYEPQTRQNCPYDLYALDLKDGKKELVTAHYFPDTAPEGSPDGKHLCYAKEGQWWIYDVVRKKSTCLTSSLSSSFFIEDLDMPAEEAYHGLAGWTKNNEVILYDRFDIWLISFDGKVTTRLTKGREMQKKYRIKTFDDKMYYDSTHYRKYLFDLSQGFLITSSNGETGETGLAYWDQQSGLKEYVWVNRKITQVIKAEKKNVYIYIDQNFVNAPRLMLYNRKAKEIFQSNSQQKHFLWGRNERIDYTVYDKKVKGILFYPAGYEKGKKYPMVLHVYESQYSFLNDYQNPSLLLGAGFNVTNYNAQGYFVLLPDIVYNFGDLRKSVTKSVLSAVDAAVAKGDIESDKIGIVGHSFGGYETNLIITQTGRFAAAVAGAACSDLVSTYLYVGPSFRRPDFFRTENHQLRIGKSLYQDMSAYLHNSPVLMAEKITTPLLGWTGEEDKTVFSMQSMEFYLAMRRLNKEHTLLVYPQEGHELYGKENQIDLNVRIMQWFDYYLKNGRKQEWMQSDFNR
ncbi:prolyl oligopeptidase family serine peptidase [Flavobacterium sp. SORGH_AS_0622]|uniref:S9 family peptidase n=1 Tax=Flavobacterium sp. SORGH_AS_0622 TaxID=3041772 RepID=UPI0027D8C60B|nr:prolyl oligopeptidase family serine peptidase [Flavobacterium sp. SORGH_AS_0622]